MSPARVVLSSILTAAGGALVAYGFRSHDYSLVLFGIASLVCGFVFAIFDGKGGEQ